MKVCYIDEAGCCGSLPHASSDIQPVLVICGLFVDYGHLHDLTKDLLNLKRDMFPGRAPDRQHYLSNVLSEIKGSELRKNACADGRNMRRHTLGFMDKSIRICENADARIVGRVWVKKIGAPINGRSIYTSSIQAIASSFQDYLARHEDLGVIIADSRVKNLNAQVAHSIFTKKFKGGRDDYDRIVELPTFGHSENHVGIQLVDTICSGIVTPMAVHGFCAGHLHSLHVRQGYSRIQRMFATRINALQHTFQEASGRHQLGLVVSDGLGRKPSSNLYISAANDPGAPSAGGAVGAANSPTTTATADAQAPLL